MDIFKYIPIAIKYLEHRDEVEEIVQTAAPALAEIKRVLPKLVPLARALIAEIAPDMLDTVDLKALSTYDVKLIQESLNKLGEKLKVDGYPGKDTRKAIERFQLRSGIPMDGWAGTRTVMALGAAIARMK